MHFTISEVRRKALAISRKGLERKFASLEKRDEVCSPAHGLPNNQWIEANFSVASNSGTSSSHEKPIAGVIRLPRLRMLEQLLELSMCVVPAEQLSENLKFMIFESVAHEI